MKRVYKCEYCYLQNARPCYECSACMSGDDHFRPAEPEKKQMTNADKIRAMSDEEITEFVCRNGINTLCDIICGGECNAIASFKKSGDEACKEIVMKWLQQPVKEND